VRDGKEAGRSAEEGGGREGLLGLKGVGVKASTMP
jgi:hypothetical protein